MSHDQAASREIRSRHDRKQRFVINCRIVNHGQRRIHDFTQIVWRNIRRHTNRDARPAIDQQIRKLRRQNRWFLHAIIIVWLEVDRVFVDVCQQVLRGLGHAAFCIAHRGGWIIIDRAEITLPVNQHQRHGMGLCQAHQRIINRAVAMRVIFAHHIANNRGRFAIFLVWRVTAFLHRIEDTAVNRLQTIAHIRQRAGNNHAHRIVEIRAFHLVFDIDRVDALLVWRFRHIFGFVGRVVVAQVRLAKLAAILRIA